MGKSRSLRDHDDHEWRDNDFTNNHDAAYTGEYSAEYSEVSPAYTDDYSAAYPATGEYSGEYLAESGEDRALAPSLGGANLPALAPEPETGPVLIPGTGVSMGAPFIQRRERPLTMRIAILTLMTCITVTGLFAVTPLSANADNSLSSFEALSGVVLLSHQVRYFWYVAQTGDSPENLAARFNVQVGGIYELNNLYAGQELAIGKAYKVPQDPTYGASFRPASLNTGGGDYGQTVFGSEWYNSYAGAPTPEGICGPDGHGNFMAYGFKAPNWGAYWVRGFSWYHDGVDLAAQQGNPIHAVQAGQVIWAGFDATNGFGWAVKINHCYHVSTIYGHMMAITVKVGQNVEQGDVIGYEGSTGWSTGPHLHMSVYWNNVAVNPMFFYADIYHITHNV